jgi:hypothetical protein
MVSRKALCLRLTACILAALSTSTAHAKAHDVTPGMDLREALWVVKRCILEVTAFKDPRESNPDKELRAQDKLESVGITDTSRLNALRRFIVRNTDFGVQSIWGVRRKGDSARPYILPNSALSMIKKDATIEELALEIASKAGLPFLTHAKAAQIVANCREMAKPTPPSSETGVLTAPPTPTPTPTPKPTPIPIAGDLSETQAKDLKSCITGDAGIATAGVTDGQGDFFPYVNSKSLEVAIEAVIKKGTYTALVDAVQRNASVALPAELTAPIIVRNWILNAKAPDCAERSFFIETYCTPRFRLLDNQSLGIPIVPNASTHAVSLYRKDKTWIKPEDVPDLSTVPTAATTTVRKMINNVKSLLEGKSL